MIKFILIVAVAWQALSVNGQQIYIPYKAAGKWGLADTMGKVVMPSQYDTIEYEEFSNYSDKGIYYITVKNKQKGIVYNIKTVVPNLYDYIHINRTFFYCEKGKEINRKIYLHNYSGKLLNPLPYKNISQVYHQYNNIKQTLLVATLPDNTFNLIYIDTTGTLVTLLKNQYAINNSGNEIEVKKTAAAQKQLYNISRSTKGALQLVLLPPVEENEESRAYPLDMNVAVPPADMYDGRLKSYNFIKNGDIWKSYSNYQINNIDFHFEQYDSMYITNNDYNSIYSKSPTGQPLAYSNAFITRKKGFYGMLFPDGKTIPNEYSSIQYFRFPSGNNFMKYLDKTTFLVTKENKYGIIDLDGKTIIPIQYDKISPDMVVKQGSKLGVLQTDGSFLLPLVYDEINFIQFRQQYLLQQNNKYGVMIFSTDNNSIVKMDCISPYRIRGWKRFRTNYPAYKPYIVLEAISETGNFLGYYDRKGFAYFK